MARQKGSPFGINFILNGPNAGKIYVCDVSHHVLYLDVEKKELNDILKINAVTLLPFSVFIVSGYVQHAWAEYPGYGNL